MTSKSTSLFKKQSAQAGNWFRRLILWAIFGDSSVVLHTRNGVTIDLTQKKITVHDDFHLHTEGELKFSTDKDLILLSGRSPNPDRPGYRYSIWKNPPFDAEGRPLQKIVWWTPEGEQVEETAYFDPDGYLIVPDGYSLTPPMPPEVDDEPCSCHDAK